MVRCATCQLQKGAYDMAESIAPFLSQLEDKKNKKNERMNVRSLETRERMLSYYSLSSSEKSQI